MKRKGMHPRWRVLLGRVARVGLVAWIFYYLAPQFTANVLLQEHGVRFAYTGFYWLVDFFLLAITLLYVWKHDHPLAQLGMIPTSLATGYGVTRYLTDELFIIAPVTAVFTGILTGFALLALILLFADFFGGLARRAFFPRMRTVGRSRVFRVAAVATCAWIALTSWSYFGFSQVHVVRDFRQESFSFAFWGSPSGGAVYWNDSSYTTSWYDTPELDEELDKFAELNATFYNTININTLSGNLTNRELALREWEEHGLRFIFDITPLNNETGKGDFVSYYYLREINDTIRALMDWLEPLNLSNFRGISFDVEGPIFGDDQPVSREQYRKALVSYQGILDEFKSRFPQCEVHLIQMESILFDYYDGDHDLDIMLRTTSVELDWDWYGFMTYHVTDSPTTSSYRYAYFLDQGIRQWGARFQPWVGWWYDEEAGELPAIERPGVYEQTLEHVKIAKASGAREVVLAPVRNFIGKDHDHEKIMSRLNDLVEIKNGFEPFEIPITQNMRIFNDWNLYWEKIVPYYIWSNQDVTKDLLAGTPTGWFEALQAVQVCVVVLLSAFLMFRKKRTPTRERPYPGQ